MNFKMIEEVARKNDSIKKNLIQEMKRVIGNLYSQDIYAFANRKWRFDKDKNCFKLYLDVVDHKINCNKAFYDEVFVTKFKGITAELSVDYQSGEDCYDLTLSLDFNETDGAAQSLLSILRKKRVDFYEQFENLIVDAALKYFERKKEEFCKYPTVFSSSSFEGLYGMETVWTGTLSGKNDDVVEDIQGKICYTTSESLYSFEDYHPVLFSSEVPESQKIEVYSHSKGIKAIIERNVYESKYAPLTITFIMFNSDDVHFQLALEKVKAYKNKEIERDIMTIFDKFDSMEWFKEGNVLIAHTISIRKLYEEEILKKLRFFLPSNITVDIVEKMMPRFDVFKPTRAFEFRMNL